ncbi:MAG: hypothetical protein GQ524_07565 [Anaerolineales bacterium]|nr:hypothetical protein [Anaerolineales bacterium]
MALTLPIDGEAFVGHNGGALKTFRFTVGVAGDVVVGAPATVALLNVPIGLMVHDVHTRVITAFTTSVTLTIGDGVTADGYMTSAIIAPQGAITTGIYKGMVDEGSTTFAGGKVYVAADTIDVVVAAATAAAGLMEVVVTFSESSSDDA